MSKSSLGVMAGIVVALCACRAGANAVHPIRGLELVYHGPSTVTANGTALFAATLENHSSKTVSHIGASPELDVNVTDSTGNEVWSSEWGWKAMPGMELKLAPGGSRDFRAGWNLRDPAGAPVPPGRYTVRVHVTTLASDPRAQTLIVAP